MYLRRLAAVTAAVTMTVALGACTSDDSDDEEAADSSSSAAPEATPDLPEAAVGDALEIGEATLTVHMMTRGSECDYGSDGELPAGAELVQLRAEVDNGGDAGLTLDPVNVVYEDGSSVDWPTEMKDGGTGCIQADHSDEYYNWSEELPVGGPAYVYGNISVPEGAGFLNIGGYRFEIPEDEIDDVEEPDLTPGVDEGVVPEDAPAPAAAGDYICPDSGMNVVDPEECQRPAGWTGPYYVGVDPNSGAYDPRYYHEDGTAKTSWELQTKAGCDEGYITDPELCAAVQ
ncbi:hypothetical protein ACTXLS_10240 [Corynebacterium variabile]|uniref:hypothetical protein n=1 Tax=Corynebacterium variabile TaxID=1727 RepID=UPI003FD0E040